MLGMTHLDTKMGKFPHLRSPEEGYCFYVSASVIFGMCHFEETLLHANSDQFSTDQRERGHVNGQEVAEWSGGVPLAR